MTAEEAYAICDKYGDCDTCPHDDKPSCPFYVSLEDALRKVEDKILENLITERRYPF